METCVEASRTFIARIFISLEPPPVARRRAGSARECHQRAREAITRAEGATCRATCERNTRTQAEKTKEQRGFQLIRTMKRVRGVRGAWESRSVTCSPEREMPGLRYLPHLPAFSPPLREAFVSARTGRGDATRFHAPPLARGGCLLPAVAMKNAPSVSSRLPMPFLVVFRLCPHLATLHYPKAETRRKRIPLDGSPVLRHSYPTARCRFHLAALAHG